MIAPALHARMVVLAWMVPETTNAYASTDSVEKIVSMISMNVLPTRVKMEQYAMIM